VYPYGLVLPLRANALRNYGSMDQAYFKSYFRNLDIDQEIILESSLSESNQIRTIKFSGVKSSFLKNIKARLDVPIPAVVSEEDTFSAIKIDSSIQKEKTYFLSRTFNFAASPEGEQPTLLPTGQEQRQAYFNIDQESDGFTEEEAKEFKLDRPNAVFLSPRLHEQPKDLAERFDKLVASNQIDSLIKILKKLEPRLQEITYTADYSFWCHIGLKNARIPMPIMGDGFIKIFEVLLTIINAAGGTALIDEVENGFYYELMPDFWDVVLETAKELDVQIFATTHSRECIAGFIECNANRKTPDDANLYRVEFYKGATQATLYNEKALAVAIKTGWEIR
jgi:hypothetical protein